MGSCKDDREKLPAARYKGHKLHLGKFRLGIRVKKES